MKIMKMLPVSMLAACLFLTSCQKDPTEGMTNPEISEKAMDSFLNKISEGNYTISSEGFLTTSVYSKDLVWFDYAEDIYDDFTVMSVDNESFQATLKEDGLEEVAYVSEGQAIDAASSRLLNYWLEDEVSEGNIYNLFYNDPDNPLVFVSKEEPVKRTLLSLVGYGENALRLMEDVYLEMDNIDPSVVHLKAVVNNDVVARTNFEDIDITVNFGNAQDNKAAEEWMKNPVYPVARTAWNDTDIFILNSVFLPGYGEDALPFPPFASYAFTIDQNSFVTEDAASMRDAHATEKDLEDYIALLKENGFEEEKETGEDGSEKTVYRRVLRGEYNCYTQVEPEYDNGVNLTARKHYDFPEYDSLDAVNTRIAELGYPALSDTLNYDALKGTDRADEMTESWLYFFDYESGLYVTVDFQDRAEVQSWLDEYCDTLLNAGFHTVGGGSMEELDPDEGGKLGSYLEETEDTVLNKRFRLLGDGEEDDVDYYESENGFASFRYKFTGENTVTLLYKAERYISASEAEQLISDAGFPPIELKEPISCRDLTRFMKMRYGLDLMAFTTVSQHYDSTEEAEAFLSAYEAVLTDDGYGRTDPNMAGTLKQIAIYNEEKEMTVGIDFFEGEDGVTVNFDFRAD